MNVHSSALHSSFFEWENKWMKENDIKLSWSLLFRERRLWREELPDTQDTVLVILVHVCSPHINQFCVSPLRSPSHSPQGKDFYRMPWPSVPKGHLGTCWWTEILVKTIEVRDSAIWGGVWRVEKLTHVFTGCPSFSCSLFSQKLYREKNQAILWFPQRYLQQRGSTVGWLFPSSLSLMPLGEQWAGHLTFQPTLSLGSPEFLGLYSLKGCY